MRSGRSASGRSAMTLLRGFTGRSEVTTRRCSRSRSGWSAFSESARPRCVICSCVCGRSGPIYCGRTSSGLFGTWVRGLLPQCRCSSSASRSPSPGREPGGRIHSTTKSSGYSLAWAIRESTPWSMGSPIGAITYGTRSAGCSVRWDRAQPRRRRPYSRWPREIGRWESA